VISASEFLAASPDKNKVPAHCHAVNALIHVFAWSWANSSTKPPAAVDISWKAGWRAPAGTKNGPAVAGGAV
jgi:hypothetical protein